MSCLSDASVERLVAGQSQPGDLVAIDAHLDGCTACRGRVAARARQLESRQLGDPGRSPVSIPTRRELEPAPDPWVGRIVADRYHVVRPLGGGGMGSVYEAEHVLIGRRVALKFLHPQFAASREIVRRFQNEARAAGTLGHPGIVQALDMGSTDDGTPFLVLEYLHGRDLGAEIAAVGVLPICRAVGIGLRIADALATAHAVGIVHRDLKPENVFVLENDAVKVLDFGISKMSSSLVTGPVTAPGAVMGTPAYMAPEQLQDAASASPRSDVWALGVILYRAIAGALPFRGDSLPALLLAMTSGVAPRLSAARPEVPEGLDAAIACALRADPAERFSTMEEMAKALRPFAEPAVNAIVRDPEQRVVAVLVVRGGDGAASARFVEEAGGQVAQAPEDATDTVVAVFGEGTWHGDESARAVDAALALRPDVAAAAVAMGHLTREGERVRGEALERALEALHAALAGVAVVGPTTAIASSFTLRTVTDELAEVRGRASREWSILPSTADESQPLLGRDAEVAQLRTAVDRAGSEGQPVVTFVTGSAGMGKTRLAAEVVRLGQAAPQPFALLVGRPSGRGDVPRSSIASAILGRGRWCARTRGWPRLDPEAPTEERRAAIRALAEEAVGVEAGGELASFLGELLGVPMPVSSVLAAARGNPRLMSDRLTLAVVEYLDGLSARMPVAIVLEDLQWADAESLACLDRLVAEVAWDRPLWIVGTARPELLEQAPAPFVGPDVMDVKLRGLGMVDVQTLAPWLTGEEISEEVARVLLQRTGGNPFFLEQTMRAVQDEGRSLADAASGLLPLPIDVEAAVQARLDALPEEEREVLKRAAVLGAPFDVSDLRALGAGDPSASLAALGRRGLLRRRARSGGAESWEFRTSLTAEVVYRLMLDERRRALHLRAAGVLAARASSEPELVAIHFDRAGLPAEAAPYYHRAALSAARRQDAGRVLRCAERALELGASDDALFSLHLARADALEVLGRLDEQRVALDAALSLASTPEERALATIAHAIHTLRTDHPAASIPRFEEALEAARACGDPVVLARALGRYATALVYVGRLADAVSVLAEAERIVLTSALSLRAELASWRAQLAAAEGDLAARRSAYLASVELYSELGDARNHAGASVNLADVYNRFGAYAEAEAALDDALAQCGRLGMELMQGYARANRGYARLLQGRLAEAEEDLGAAARVGASSGDARLGLWAQLYRARLRLAADRAEEALVEATAAASRAAPLGMEPAAALGWAIAARAHLVRGDTAAALDASRRALELHRRLGGLEEDEAELFAVHVDALTASGEVEEAARIRAEGRRLLEATARRIADPAWRARFLEDVPAHRALLGGPG